MAHTLDINLHNVSYEKYSTFVDAMSSGRLREAMLMAAEFIVRWDYEADLADPKAVYNMGFEDGAEVTHTLFASFKDLFANADISSVKVNFKKWNMERYIQFTELRGTNKVKQYEAMMHEVAAIEGVDPAKPLSLYNGMLMHKAVSEKANKIFNGLN